MFQAYTSLGQLGVWPAKPLRYSQPTGMTSYDPTDPTAVWFIEVHPGICEWRTSAIRACLESIQSGHSGLEAWLNTVNHRVQQRTGQGLENVASQWRKEALERSRAAYESGNWEAAARELVYYIEEVVCIYQRELQSDGLDRHRRWGGRTPAPPHSDENESQTLRPSLPQPMAHFRFYIAIVNALPPASKCRATATLNAHASCLASWMIDSVLSAMVSLR